MVCSPSLPSVQDSNPKVREKGLNLKVEEARLHDENPSFREKPRQ